MKIITSMAMSFLFLFQGMAANMEVCEQIDNLSHFISHYQDHQEEDGYSFFKYVYEDYINNDSDSNDHHKDSDHDNAPAHNSHQCCQHFVFFAPFQPSILTSISLETRSELNFHSFQLNSRTLESLFQPPKV